MNERFLDRLWQQTLTSIATVASICLVAFIVRIVNDKSSLFSALAISLSNGAFPEFAKLLVKFEGWFRISHSSENALSRSHHIATSRGDTTGHSTEAAVQTSMYIKICLFRWVNTAVVIVSLHILMVYGFHSA